MYHIYGRWCHAHAFAHSVRATGFPKEFKCSNCGAPVSGPPALVSAGQRWSPGRSVIPDYPVQECKLSQQHAAPDTRLQE